MSFSAQIAHFGSSTVSKIEQTRRAVSLKLFSSVIMSTPVDTGRLRSNWITAIGDPITTPRDGLKENSKGKIVAFNQLPINEAQDVVNRSSGDTSLYLSNNLPYAYRVEFEGWSQEKAPAGMVRINVARFGRLIKIQTEIEKLK